MGERIVDLFAKVFCSLKFEADAQMVYGTTSPAGERESNSCLRININNGVW